MEAYRIENPKRFTLRQVVNTMVNMRNQHLYHLESRIRVTTYKKDENGVVMIFDISEGAPWGVPEKPDEYECMFLKGGKDVKMAWRTVIHNALETADEIQIDWVDGWKESGETPPEEKKPLASSSGYYINKAQDQFRKRLGDIIEQGKKAEKDFIERIKKDGLVYTMEWAKDYSKIVFEARLAKQMLFFVDQSADLVSLIESTKEELVDNLLKNKHTSNSSSPYHNAVQDEKRQATSDFVQYTIPWLEAIIENNRVK